MSHREAAPPQTIMQITDDLGHDAARIECMAEEGARNGDVSYFPQINADATAILRGLSKVRDAYTAEQSKVKELVKAARLTADYLDMTAARCPVRLRKALEALVPPPPEAK